MFISCFFFYVFIVSLNYEKLYYGVFFFLFLHYLTNVNVHRRSNVCLFNFVKEKKKWMIGLMF
jgi:hypothetical protein